MRLKPGDVMAVTRILIAARTPRPGQGMRLGGD